MSCGATHRMTGSVSCSFKGDSILLGEMDGISHLSLMDTIPHLQVLTRGWLAGADRLGRPPVQLNIGSRRWTVWALAVW